MKRSKICCVLNDYPHYRLPILSALDKKYDVDFFFGSSFENSLEVFDPTKLRGFKKVFRCTMLWKNFIWFHHIHVLLRPSYTHYLLTGAPNYLANWIILVYGKIFRKRVILWTHGVKQLPSSVLGRLYLKSFYWLCSDALIYGDSVRERMGQFGFQSEKLMSIHNSLDTDLQTELFHKMKHSTIYEKHFLNTDPVLVFIGRLQENKKIGILIEAIERILIGSIGVNLVLIGKNIMGVDLQNRIQNSKYTTRIWVYGETYNEEKIAELLYNADVCVSPGVIGLTAIHALSYGIPVVTSNDMLNQMPESEAIIPNITGNYFKGNNIEDLCEKISYWATIGEEKRTLLRKIARETVLKEWSVDYQMKVFHAVLDGNKYN